MKIALLITLIAGLSFGNALQNLREIGVNNISQIVEIGQIVYPDSRIWDMAFQAENSVLVAIVDYISGSPPVRYYDVSFVNTESLEIMVKTEEVLQATAIAFSDDGSLMAIGDWQGEIAIFATEDYRLIVSFPPVGLVVTNLAFSPDHSLIGATFGNPVLSGEGEYAFQLWALTSGELVFSSPFGDGVYGGGVTFDGTNEGVFFSITDPTITVENSVIQAWNAATGQANITLYEARAFSDELIFDPRTSALFYMGEESVHVTYPFTSESNSDIQLGNQQEGEYITSMALHPNEPLLAIGFQKETPRLDGGTLATNAGIIRLYNTQTSEELITLEVPEGAITNLAFNSEGTLLASGGMDGTVRLWGVPAGE